MKRLIVALLLFAQSAFAVDIFNVPVQFAVGSSITVAPTVPMLGTWDFSGAIVLGISGGTITLTGNVTGTGTGTIATTIVTIPDLVAEPGSILFSKVAMPIAPSAGQIKLYADSTDSRIHDRNDAGTTGTTVVSSTAATHQFATGIGTNGVVSYAQPVPGDINGAIPLSGLATQAANTVVGNATGGTAVPTAVVPATARTSSLLNIDQKQAIGDASYTILATDRTVVTTTAFTAGRTWTLPAANSVNAGQALDIQDLAGAVNGVNTLMIQVAGADKICPPASGNSSFSITANQVGFGLTLKSDGVSKWYVSAFDPGGSPQNHKPVTSDGRVFQLETYSLPSTAGSADYTINSDGTNFRAYPTGLAASSVTTVSAGYAADTYLAGSAVTVAAGDFKAQGQYHCVFDMNKTGAGVVASVVTVRVGTAGTTADAAICTLTFGTQTATVDVGNYEIWVTFRTVGSGTSAVFNAVGELRHKGGTVGLSTIPLDWAQNLSAGFATNTATKIGVSFNGGASFSGTSTLAQATLTQP